MLTIDGNTIILTRGDTAYIEVPIVKEINGDVEDYEIQENDVLILTVKKKSTDEDYLIQKRVTGANTFHIVPTDTKTLKFGDYVYDIELDTEDGDIFTVVTESKFKIGVEVT